MAYNPNNPKQDMDEFLFGAAAQEADEMVEAGVDKFADAVMGGVDAVYDGIDAAGDFVNKTVPDKVKEKGGKVARALTPEMQARMEKLSMNMSSPSKDDEDFNFDKRSRYL